MATDVTQSRELPKTSLSVQLLLLSLVVITGSLNNIFKQIASKIVGSYTYMLSLASALILVPLYGGSCWFFWRRGSIPRGQLEFVWKTEMAFGMPVALYFLAASLGDTLGDGIGMICTPYVAGPVHSLLSNFTPIWIALLAFPLLHSRYSLLQCFGMVAVLAAVAVGLVPTFAQGSSDETDPFFAGILAGSCIFNAVSWVLKELVFSRFAAWKTSRGDEDPRGMHIILVQAHLAVFSLPLTLLCVPLNKALGQMHGEDVLSYLGEGAACMLGDCPGGHEDFATAAVGLYLFFNFTWNILIMLSVSYNGALASFIALKGIFPVSTILFAFVDWPILGRTAMHPLMWLALILMLPAIAVYQYASDQQNKRKTQGLATCCWPLTRSDVNEIQEPFVSIPQKYACPYHDCPCPTKYDGAPCSTACILLCHRDGIRDV